MLRPPLEQVLARLLVRRGDQSVDSRNGPKLEFSQFKNVIVTLVTIEREQSWAMLH